MKHLWKTLLIFVVCLPVLVLAQDTFVSEIFPDNPCQLPCFFNMSVGESTSQDVLHMLMDNLETFLWRITVEDATTQFDRETGYMTEGEYLAYWQAGERFTQSPTVFTIRDGILQQIIVEPMRRVSLEMVLEELPSPSHVYFYRVPNTLHLTLIYLENQLFIPFFANPETCSLENIDKAAFADQFGYATELDLSVFNSEGVPLNVWTQWLTDQPDMLCTASYRVVKNEPCLNPKY